MPSTTQPAPLQVGNEIPITTGSATSLSNSNTPVVDTIEMRNTGVILKVLPHVNSNGTIRLEVDQKISGRRRAALDLLGEGLLDANRTIARPDKITVIFGRKVTKHYRGKLQTEIEDMNLLDPVVRRHYGNGFIKQYVRDHLILSTEAASNNVNDYGVNKAVENLPVLHKAMSAIHDNYLDVQ